jgi:hypothetical protein
MATRYAIAMLKGKTPEMFVVVGVDFQKGEPRLMSKAMSELEIRQHLAKQGASRQKIDEVIERARENPQ